MVTQPLDQLGDEAVATVEIGGIGLDERVQALERVRADATGPDRESRRA